ncbi:MAG: hypothetical protein QM598_13065 [Protaetiibacter sp.]
MTRIPRSLAGLTLAGLVVIGGLAGTSASFTAEAAVDGNRVRTGTLTTPPLIARPSGGSGVDLSWDAVGDGQAPVRYAVARTSPGAPVTLYSGTGTTAHDSGRTTAALAPVSFTAVAAGYDHSLALASDGTLWAWGSNVEGQLGTGALAAPETATPTPVVALPGPRWFTAVDAGKRYSLALASDGTAWAWGANDSGQLGTIGHTPSSTPVRVEINTPLVAISAGENHALALDRDGSVWAWGANGFGQLGVGDTQGTFHPERVSTLPSGVRFAAVGAGAGHSVAMTSDGRVWGWGSNTNRQLGPGAAATNVPTAVRMLLPTGVVAENVTAGTACTFVLATDGSVWAWGLDAGGQLGDGAGTSGTAPVRVLIPTGHRLVSLSSGYFFSVGREANGTSWAWGYNGFGNLGDGTTDERHAPMPVLISSTAIDAGTSHALGVAPDGAVWAWGNSGSGKLGNTGGSTNFPMPVDRPSAPRCPGGSYPSSTPGECEYPPGTAFHYVLVSYLGNWSGGQTSADVVTTG